MKKIIDNILSFLFPFQDLNNRPSVFVQQTWLDKIMTSSTIKDYLWSLPISKN